MNRVTGSLALVCLLISSSSAAFSPEAKGAGRAGAYSQFASGAEGMWWNPGVLGEQLIASGSLGIGIEAGNNALKLSKIIDLISNPSDAKKHEVVAEIRKLKDEDNELWKARINGGGIGAVAVKIPAAGSFAVSVIPRMSLAADDVTADAVEFALFYDPNDLSKFPPATPELRPYDFGGKLTRSTFMEIGVGYAREIPEPLPAIGLNAGITLKYLHGVDYNYAMTSQKFNLYDLTPPTSESQYLTSRSGKGFGADLGLKAEIMGMAKAAIVVRNIGAKIKWDAEGERGYFNQSTLDFVSTSYTEEKEQELPTVVSLAAGGALPGVGTSLGIQADIGPSEEGTTVGLGAEQGMMGVMALRAGYSFNSEQSSSLITFGFGMGALAGGFDLAVGMSPDGKSASCAVSGSVSF